MKLSKELLLKAVNAAFEFNAENKNAGAMVSYDTHGLTLGLNLFGKDGGFTYYEITNFDADHEKNVSDFILALKSHSSTL